MAFLGQDLGSTCRNCSHEFIVRDSEITSWAHLATCPNCEMSTWIHFTPKLPRNKDGKKRAKKISFDWSRCDVKVETVWLLRKESDLFGDINPKDIVGIFKNNKTMEFENIERREALEAKIAAERIGISVEIDWA